MSTKEQLLELLENNRGGYLSGEEIAEKLSVSRTAIWKAVKSLRNEGYIIDAVNNKGYSLSNSTDVVSSQGIRKYIDDKYLQFGTSCINLDIEYFPSVDSTNNIARAKAVDGISEGYAAIAGNQTKGRGRRGRNFYSPSDTGIYMSLLLRPKNCPPIQATKLTSLAAVAVCEAIEKVAEKKADIKWVNDVFIDGKKVCGILTEASVGLEDNSIEYAIVGIGLNVDTPEGGFPENISKIAGAIFDDSADAEGVIADRKNRLAAEVLNSFMKYYEEFPKTGFADEYRKRCFVIGKEITVMSGEGLRTAVALGVDDEFHLDVRYDDGSTDNLSSGEISIRVK